MPPESEKDGKGEDEAPKDEAAKEKQEDSEKSAGEEKSQEKTEEAGTKTDTKVRSVTHSICLSVNSKLVYTVCLWRGSKFCTALLYSRETSLNRFGIESNHISAGKGGKGQREIWKC